MATALPQHQYQPTLLGIPAELRLRIYDYIIPSPVLHIDLCASRPANDSVLPFNLPMPRPGQRKPSILTNLSKNRHTLEVTVKCNNGIQLLSVCQQINAEVEPIFAGLTVLFHCFRCFKDTMENFRYDDGWYIRWMRNVEIIYDAKRSAMNLNLLPRPGSMRAEELATRQVVERCRNLVRERYGRLDLVGKEKWSYGPAHERMKKVPAIDNVSHSAAGSNPAGGNINSALAAPGNARPTPSTWIIRGQIDLKWSSKIHDMQSDWYTPWPAWKG